MKHYYNFINWLTEYLIQSDTQLWLRLFWKVKCTQRKFTKSLNLQSCSLRRNRLSFFKSPLSLTVNVIKAQGQYTQKERPGRWPINAVYSQLHEWEWDMTDVMKLKDLLSENSPSRLLLSARLGWMLTGDSCSTHKSNFVSVERHAWARGGDAQWDNTLLVMS